jgi:hypothetical protein
MNTLSVDNLSEKNKNSIKHTTTMTFRLDSNILQKIYDKAEQDDISINSLVNHILKRYVEWDMFENKSGMVPVSKPVVKDLFGRLSKEEVIDVSTKIAKNSVYDLALFMKGKVDPDSFISWFLSRMKSCSEIASTNENGISTFILKHELGENWSLYHKTVVESIFNDFLHKPIHISITGSTMVMNLENNRYQL